jgi:hypothetical protein
MPWSVGQGREFLKEWITIFKDQIKTVIDIGPGAGAYAKLIRELNFRPYLIGIEIFAPYVERFGLIQLYNEVLVYDGYKYLRDNPRTYDLVLLGDIVEHFQKENAIELVSFAQIKSKFVFISIPCKVKGRAWSKGWKQTQSEWMENNYEKHLYDWEFGELINTFHPMWVAPYPVSCCMILEGNL